MNLTDLERRDTRGQMSIRLRAIAKFLRQQKYCENPRYSSLEVHPKVTSTRSKKLYRQQHEPMLQLSAMSTNRRLSRKSSRE